MAKRYNMSEIKNGDTSYFNLYSRLNADSWFAIEIGLRLYNIDPEKYADIGDDLIGFGETYPRFVDKWIKGRMSLNMLLNTTLETVDAKLKKYEALIIQYAPLVLTEEGRASLDEYMTELKKVSLKELLDNIPEE
jgi:hypothetical protein